MDKEELLKVLDMSEQEQAVWTEKPEHGNRQMGECLAYVAFRLRDEAVNMTNNWVPARIEVYKHCIDTPKELHPETIVDNSDTWFISVAKPIHWIIAALIAKGSYG